MWLFSDWFSGSSPGFIGGANTSFLGSNSTIWKMLKMTKLQNHYCEHPTNVRCFDDSGANNRCCKSLSTPLTKAKQLDHNFL